MAKVITVEKIHGLCEDAVKLRTEIFVEEQGFKEEFDGIDQNAVHLVFYIKDRAVAVCRYYKNESPDNYTVGRIAVRKAYRGKNIGKYMMEELEKSIKEEGGAKIRLSAQMQACPFYKKMGYQEVGAPYMEEFCKHIQMVKTL